MSIARNEGESFAAFKERREEDNYQTQQALKPKMFWDSIMEGTYVKGDDAYIAKLNKTKHGRKQLTEKI